MRRMYSLNQLKEIALEKIESTTNLHIFENIVDKNGNPRFIEGTPNANVSGITYSYKKWSLSGTHLMIVVAGTVADTTVLPAGTDLAQTVLPKWISDKIYPVFQNAYISIETVVLRADDWSGQDLPFVVAINNEYGLIDLYTVSELTLTKERHFRIQIDLLIDDE